MISTFLRPHVARDASVDRRAVRVMLAWAALAVLAAPSLHAESTAGVHWTGPAGWPNQGESPMRAASYLVPRAPGDTLPAECVVYFFGAGQGGSIDANMERWSGQFAEVTGAPAKAAIGHRVIHGMKTTTIDVSGVYSGMGGPMAAGAHKLPGYRLLGAILEGPGGNIFVKFTGQAATVAAAAKAYEQLLASFEAAAR